MNAPHVSSNVRSATLFSNQALGSNMSAQSNYEALRTFVAGSQEPPDVVLKRKFEDAMRIAEAKAMGVEGEEQNEPSSSKDEQPHIPISMNIPIHMDAVLYDVDKHTGSRKLNIRDPPCDAPHPGMVFKGYVFSNDGKSVTAWFVQLGAKGPGVRRSRASGCINKQFYKELETQTLERLAM